LIHSLREGRAYKVPNDQIITPTFARNLARVVRRLVDDRRCGIFHLSGSVPLLRNEFAQLIAETFSLDPDLIVPVSTADLNLHAPRPKSAGLRCDKVQALLDFGVAGPGEGLGKMKDELQQEPSLESSASAIGRD
jgi:dTDP-4-dehydrorhamnose reductase